MAAPNAGATPSVILSERLLLLTAASALCIGALGGLTVSALVARKRRSAGLGGDAPRSLPAPSSSSAAPSTPAEACAVLTKHFNSLVAADRAARCSSSSASSSSATPTLVMREALPRDLEALMAQWVESYNASAASMGSPPMFPSLESSRALITGYVTPGLGKVGLVALRAPSSAEGKDQQQEGEILASAFNDESDIERGIVGCGPWTVTWDVTSSGIGRELFQRLVSDALGRGARSLRLLQGCGNLPAMALYTRSLGFEVREPLVFFSGNPNHTIVEAVMARATRDGRTAHQWGGGEDGNEDEDIAQCDTLWRECTGFSRQGALRIIATSPNRKAKRWLVKEAGKVIAFTTGFGSMGSSCASSVSALQFLLCAAAADAAATASASAAASSASTPPPAAAPVPLMLHACTRLYPHLTQWLLDSGMRLTRSANLMVLGEWTPIPHTKFVYCPSTELA